MKYFNIHPKLCVCKAIGNRTFIIVKTFEGFVASMMEMCNSLDTQHEVDKWCTHTHKYKGE